MRLRLPLVSVLATALVVPATVVLPTVAVGRVAPHPVAPVFAHLALSGVDPVALREESTPRTLVHALERGDGLAPGVASARAASTRPAVLTGRLSTAGYAMVGVTWRPDTVARRLVVSLRARTDGGWTRWRGLYQEADTPSGGERTGLTRTGTAPLWVGPSDGVQVRVDVLSGGLPRGLRVDLIDPGTSPADAQVAARPPAGSAYAAAARPDIVTRAEWGADESLRDTHLDMSRTIKAAFVHHTAGSNDYTRAEAPALIRGLLAYLTGSMGYADINYNFLVDRFGTIYEGRYGSITTPVRQAATGGFNKDTMSVVAMGNFVSAPAPDAMVHGIAEILAFRLGQYHRNPFGSKVLVAEDGSSRYAVGDRVRFKEISGHMDSSITACPGAKLYARLPDIRREVEQLMGASLVEPRASTTSVALGDPTRVAVVARPLTPMRWTLTVSRACDGTVVRELSGTAEPGTPISTLWKGRDDHGDVVPAGRYVVALSGEDDASRAVPWRRTVAVQVGSPGHPWASRELASSPSGRYVPTAPTRLLSTATGYGIAAPVLLGPGATLQVPVLGHAGVPASEVSAVAVSVVASCAGAATTVSVGPSRVPVAAARAVSVDSGGTATGMAVTGVGSDGAVTVRNSDGAVSVTLTVVGYWTTARGGDGYVPLTRTALPGTARGLAVGGKAVRVPVLGVAGVPGDADTVVVNVRRAASGTAGRVWLWPTGAKRPAPASLQRPPGQPATQRVIVPVGADGSVSLAADGTARVRLDVVGYLGAGGSGLHPVAPRRLTPSGLRLDGGQARAVQVSGAAGVPEGAGAALLQLSGVDAAGATRLTVLPAGLTSSSTAADLVVPDGASRTNLVVVPLSSNGRVRVSATGVGSGVMLTVVGWLG